MLRYTRDMKTVSIIWLLALIVGLLSWFWMQHEIHKFADQNPPETCPVWLVDSPHAACK